VPPGRFNASFSCLVMDLPQKGEPNTTRVSSASRTSALHPVSDRRGDRVDSRAIRANAAHAQQARQMGSQPSRQCFFVALAASYTHLSHGLDFNGARKIHITL